VHTSKLLGLSLVHRQSELSLRGLDACLGYRDVSFLALNANAIHAKPGRDG